VVKSFNIVWFLWVNIGNTSVFGVLVLVFWIGRGRRISVFKVLIFSGLGVFGTEIVFGQAGGENLI
jgi:hypothetical protein